MKRKLIILFALANITSLLLAYERLQGPTQVTYWDKTKTYDGYTLFGAQGTTYLIDMEGRVAHTWPVGVNPRLLDNGNVLDVTSGTIGGFSGLREADWSGSTVWSYTETRTNYFPHHDFLRIYNGKLGTNTTLYIANKAVTSNQCVTAGCNPASGAYTNVTVDAIIEVNASGNVIWEWCFFDHVVQDIDPTKSTYGVIANTPGKIDLNIRGNPVKSDWMHCNSLDFNQSLDMIVINSVHGEFYVVDHGNTFVPNDPVSSIALAAGTAGDFRYRFGDPAKYDQGDPPSVEDNWEKATAGNKQLGGSHDIQWIRPGLPGEGHFMVFCNAQNLFELSPQSYVIEINPYLNSAGVNTGQFVNPPDAGYTIVNSPDANLMKEKKNVSNQIVWTFSSKNNTTFFSTIGSSAQRLPNGNTLICAMNDGHFFEVYPNDSTIAWEYINPMTRLGIKKVKVDNYPTFNGVFRAYRYTADNPALVGHDLTPGNTMTGSTPSYYTPNDLTAINEIPALESSDILKQNYPNPFSTNTTIDFSLVGTKRISLVIYDFSGNFIKTLASRVFSQGDYSMNWDGTNENGNQVVSGIYFYMLRADNKLLSKKMILIR